MKIHLFWIDKNWKRNGGVANNYNLIVDMENKTYKVFINPYYAYNRAEDIEGELLRLIEVGASCFNHYCVGCNVTQLNVLHNVHRRISLG